MPTRDDGANSLGGLGPLVLLLRVSPCVYGVAPSQGQRSRAAPCGSEEWGTDRLLLDGALLKVSPPPK